MKSFKGFMSESYVNALPDDIETKEKYKDQVWDVLQSSYASIGGIKGSGFANKDDMLNIPFWKMNVVNGKVIAVIMYKDKGGRKSVALGTDGSPEGIAKIRDAVKSDFKRSYGEKSKSALGLALKSWPEDVIKQFMITPDQVENILRKPVTAVKDMDDGDIPADGKKTLSRYPWLKDFAYIRHINGEPVFKAMIGTPGATIR